MRIYQSAMESRNIRSDANVVSSDNDIRMKPSTPMKLLCQMLWSLILLRSESYTHTYSPHFLIQFTSSSH